MEVTRRVENALAAGARGAAVGRASEGNDRTDDSLTWLPDSMRATRPTISVESGAVRSAKAFR